MSIEDIKPDTSLYADTVDKLRAITAVIEEKRAGNTIEWRKRDGASEWQECGPTEPKYSDCVLLEYRVAPPKPREVFLVFNKGAGMYDGFQDEGTAREVASKVGGTYAKFVEVL